MLAFDAKLNLYDLHIQITKLFKYLFATASESKYTLLKMASISNCVEVGVSDSILENIIEIWDAINVMIMRVIKMIRMSSPLEVFWSFIYLDYLLHVNRFLIELILIPLLFFVLFSQ